MVHLRLNEKTSNPNPYVNFTNALPAATTEDEKAAHELLRALAAQVKPIMKKHGFTVNSLEEYEFNRVFSGRNWNAGETIELVLRRPSGTFYPLNWLLNTFCHELAHIKHMHHAAPFQALWRQLNGEVEALRRRGYEGDGMWSAGIRMGDGARVGGTLEVAQDELPEYTCGGAGIKQSAKRRKRKHTHRKEGAKTGKTKKRKPGARVRKELFGDGGERLGGSAEEKGRAKVWRVRSQTARDARAEAAERRLRALQPTKEEEEKSEEESEDEEDDDEVDEPESDDETRRAGLLRQMKLEELDLLRTSPLSASGTSGGASGWGRGGVIDLTEEELPDVEDMLQGEDFVFLSSSERAHAHAPSAPKGNDHPTNGEKGKGSGGQGVNPHDQVVSSGRGGVIDLTGEELTDSFQGEDIVFFSSGHAHAPLSTPNGAGNGRPTSKEKRKGKQKGNSDSLQAASLKEKQDKRPLTLNPTSPPPGPAELNQSRLGPTIPTQPRQPEDIPDRGQRLDGPGKHEDEKWACAMCTFVNDWLMPRCEMCDRERP